MTLPISINTDKKLWISVDFSQEAGGVVYTSHQSVLSPIEGLWSGIFIICKYCFQY